MKELIDESIYTRVTSPLQAYNGLKDIPQNILDYAADRGTRVHHYCDLYANDMLFGDIDQDCLSYVQAFVNWFDSNVIKVISTEQRMFCEDLMLQGQSDLIAQVKGHSGLTLIDIKTSCKPSKTWSLQTAAYQALCRSNGIQIDDRLVVQVKKDSSSQVYPFLKKDYLKDMTIYAGILEAYRYFL